MPVVGLGAIFAGISIATIASTAMMLGTVLTVVGAVTKNKLVSQIGMGLGLAGGITSLAGAMGVFSQGATLGSVFGGAPATGFEGINAAALAGQSGSTATGVLGSAGTVAKAGQGLLAPTPTPTDLASQKFSIDQTAPTPPVAGVTAPLAPVAPVASPAPTATVAGAGPLKWSEMSTDAKAKLVGEFVAGGAQVVGGAMGGLFEGMQASEKLEFEKMVNAQQEAHRTQSPGLIQFQPKPTA